MSEITGGKASFRRVVQPAPYEAAEAMLEYAFTVEPGEEASAKGAEALALAKRQVLAAVGKASHGEPVGSVQQIGADAETRRKLPQDEQPAPAKKPRGRPAGSKKKDVMAEDDGVSPIPEADQNTGEITDQALQEAAKKAAGRVTGAVVRAYMTEKFDGCAQLSKLDQADRAKFITGLDKLEKPKG